MRYIFSHSLSASDLYLGCDESICSKNIAWFKNNFDVDLKTRHDYFGHVLTYTFDIIVQYMLENKVRFVGPKNLFHIDIEMFDEELFMKLRRKGKFQDIDIIESDFKGYQLAFYYKAYSGLFRKHNLYTTKKHHNILLERINSGDKMYTIKDVTLNYFIPIVANHFGFTITESRRILFTGFFRIYSSLRRGCYVSLDSKHKLKSLFFIGRFHKDPEAQIKDYFFRTRLKYAKMYYWSKETPTDYHYIGISKNIFPDWVKLNDSTNAHRIKSVKFEKVFARKQIEVVSKNSTYIYIFKVKIPIKHRTRLNYYVESERFVTEYVGKAINYKFYPEDKTWQDLIREFKNEERNS